MLKLYEASTLNFVSSLAAFEVRSAIRRREFEGDLTNSDADKAAGLLKAELSRTSQIDLSTVAASSVEAIIDRYRLRAMDAIQLASALLVAADQSGLEFVSADVRLLRAAQTEGLTILDPTTL
jgi:predicted nucleic acid-binding protein